VNCAQDVQNTLHQAEAGLQYRHQYLCLRPPIQPRTNTTIKLPKYQTKLNSIMLNADQYKSAQATIISRASAEHPGQKIRRTK
jgi:hypothetical protein